MASVASSMNVTWRERAWEGAVFGDCMSGGRAGGEEIRQ